MHLGPNMAGGHYIAYVKTTVNLECYRTCGAREKARKMSNLSSDSGKSNNHKGNNILYNLFKNKGNNSSSNNINEKINDSKMGIGNNNNNNNYQNGNNKIICRSLDCCGVKNNNKMTDLISTGGNNSVLKKEDGESLLEESVWIACDDDNIKVLRGSEVEELLAKNSTSNATPYLLFYSRRTE